MGGNENTLTLDWGAGQGTNETDKAADTRPVSLALVVDVSGSITNADYAIQRDGTALALRNIAPDIAAMAEDGTPVIASFIEFTGTATVRIAPRPLLNEADVEALSAEIDGMYRVLPNSGTLVSEGLSVATAVHDQVEQQYGPLSRKVTDISADGYGSSPMPYAMQGEPESYELERLAVVNQRDIAFSKGIEINGIVMPDLEGNISLTDNDSYHRNNTITGFAVTVHNAEEYGETLEMKLRRELLIGQNDTQDVRDPAIDANESAMQTARQL